MGNNNEIGNMDDNRCRANMIRKISRRECRNNCKYWGYLNKKNIDGTNKRGCKLGY